MDSTGREDWLSRTPSKVSAPPLSVTVAVNVMGRTPPCWLSKFDHWICTWLSLIFFTLLACCFWPQIKLVRCVGRGACMRKETPHAGQCARGGVEGDKEIVVLEDHISGNGSGLCGAQFHIFSHCGQRGQSGQLVERSPVHSSPRFFGSFRCVKGLQGEGARQWQRDSLSIHPRCSISCFRAGSFAALT